MDKLNYISLARIDEFFLKNHDQYGKANRGPVGWMECYQPSFRRHASIRTSCSI